MKFIKIIAILCTTILFMTGCHSAINSEKQTTADITVQTETEIKTTVVDEEKIAKQITKSFDLDNFDQIYISDAIITKVTKGDQFKVEVTADERMFDYLKVKTEDGMLKAGVKSEKSPKELLGKTIRLDIVCPKLKGIKASDASAITLLSKFEVSDNCKISLSDSSRFDGDIDSDNLTLDISDASSAQIDGNFVYDCKINLSDSSTFKGGINSEHLTLKVSDASSAQIDGNFVHDCKIKLADSSTIKGDIHGEQLMLNINDASNAQFGGNFSHAEITLSNASNADLSDTVFDNADVDISDASVIKIAANHDINLNASTVSVVTVLSGNLVNGNIDKTVSIIKD